MLTAKLKTQLAPVAISLLIVVSAQLGYAGQPVIWETGSRAELLKGDARGISISDTGVLTLAPNVAEVFNTEQAFVWSSAIDSQGNIYLGTGHDGKIFRVGADGRGSLLYDAAELDITALAIARDGSIYAGSSPDGKVYRITTDGHAEVFFDPADKYIWSLAILNDGSLAVGTGDSGKLYRVRAAGAKPESSLLLSTNQTHVMSLAVTPQGDLIAGTDPSGLVLRISPEGKAFALFDAPLREIHALAPAADGSIYALALSDSAATSRQQSTTVPVPQPSDGVSGGTPATSVTITAIDESGNPIQSAVPATRSRTDTTNARSVVFRILPDGATDVVWSSSSITAFAIAPALEQGSVLIGTADKGRIYSVTNDGRDTLLLQSTEGQISSFMTRAGQIYAASSNQGKLFRFGKETFAEGSYESAVRDAKLTATWGRIWWRGAGNVELQTRSGNGERPDTTWSDWSTAYRSADGTQVTSPRARFIQWRATLRSAGGPAWMEDATVAYLPRNVAPEVLSVTSLPFGVGLQPGAQIQVDPNIESSGLDPSLFGAVAQVPPRRIFQRGARSFQWQAEDRNNDTLEYAIYYRALNETTFRLLKDKLRDNFYTIDGATLADGRYIIKITASDAPDNPAGEALSGERLSEPVDIDNTPPVVRAAAGQPGAAAITAFDVDDATGKIRRADFSVDGGPWTPLFPDDGIADSGHERYSVALAALARGEHTVSLRAFDSSGNVGTLSVTVRR